MCSQKTKVFGLAHVCAVGELHASTRSAGRHVFKTSWENWEGKTKRNHMNNNEEKKVIGD